MKYSFLLHHASDSVNARPGSIWRAGNTVWSLCSAFNHATDPARPMTEWEHHRSNQYARAINSRMRRLGIVYGTHYKELSNGEYWPIRINNH